MVKRQLDKTEKDAISKSIARIEAENKYNEYVKKYSELLLNEGLEQSYLQKKRELSKQLRDLTAEIKGNNDTLTVLKDQLKNGVEIIEKKQEA